MNTQNPIARKEKLVVRELEGETLVYDLARNKAFCLNRTAAAVWKSSDGRKNAARIADELSAELGASIDEEVVWTAIDQLGRDNLLEYCVPTASGKPGVTRRKQLKYLGRAAAIAPVVAALTAPKAEAAQSCLPPNRACTPGSVPCCKGACAPKPNGRGSACKG